MERRINDSNLRPDLTVAESRNRGVFLDLGSQKMEEMTEDLRTSSEGSMINTRENMESGSRVGTKFVRRRHPDASPFFLLLQASTGQIYFES